MKFAKNNCKKYFIDIHLTKKIKNKKMRHIIINRKTESILVK
jgi:hypothetical protein